MSAIESTLILQRMLANMEFESGMLVTSWKKEPSELYSDCFCNGFDQRRSKDESSSENSFKTALDAVTNITHCRHNKILIISCI